MFRNCLLLSFCLVCVPAAWGQPGVIHGPNAVKAPPASHVPVSVPGEKVDLGALEQRLRDAFQQSDLQQQLQQLLKDPELFDIDRALVENMLKAQQSGVTLNKDDIQKLRALLKAGETLPGVGPVPPPPEPPPGTALPTPNTPGLPQNPVAAEDRAAALEQLRSWAKYLGRLDGPWRDSPTLRGVVEDLARFTLQGGKGGGPEESLDVQLARLNQLGRQAEAWWQSAQAFGNRIDPGIGGWSWGGPGSNWPRTDLPRGPGFDSPSAEGASLLLWVVVLALFAVAAWELWRRRAGTSWQRLLPWRLGPWPVDPQTLATRDELVKGFEYLSLRDFGLAARFWTHGKLAERLGGHSAGRKQAAAELAHLYEQARYAPASDALSPDDMAVARHHLCFLAGVPSA